MVTKKSRIGNVLMTISAIIYGIVPPLADFNQTHAINPFWPGHARFHVVWQVIITTSLSLLSLYLLWKKKTDKPFSRQISFVLGLIVLGGFILNSLLMPLYGGILLVPYGMPPKVPKIDGNLVIFTTAFVLLLTGYFLTSQKSEQSAAQ